MCPFCFWPFLSTDFNGDVSSWPGSICRKLTPDEVVERVKKSAGPARSGFTCGMMGLIGGEPTIHYEYIIEAGRLCHERGSISKLHTSGYISEQIFTNITKAVDVIVISVKGSASKALYQRMGADRDVILRSIELAWETPRVDGSVRQAAGILIGNLIGPGLEPIKEETERFGSWIANKLDPYVQVMVEGMLGPVGNFTDLPPIILGDRDRYLRVQNVGEALFGAGLKNVWMQLPGLAATTFPVKRWMWPNGEKRFDDE